MHTAVAKARISADLDTSCQAGTVQRGNICLVPRHAHARPAAVYSSGHKIASPTPAQRRLEASN